MRAWSGVWVWLASQVTNLHSHGRSATLDGRSMLDAAVKSVESELGKVRRVCTNGNSPNILFSGQRAGMKLDEALLEEALLLREPKAF